MAPALGQQVLAFAIKLFASAIILSLAAFWSCIVACGTIYNGFRKGFGKAFYHQDRTKGPPPIHFSKWDLETRHNPGSSTKPWNHAYITLPKTGMRFHYVYSGKVPSHISISAIDGETAMNGDFEEETIDHHRPKLMLCVHGFPECWFSWRHILRAYDKQPEEGDEYFVVAIDLRGYGDSDIPQGRTAYHLNNLTCDIKGLVNAFGYEKCVYVGHDWGGGIGWVMSATYPEVMEKFIVMNSAHGEAFIGALRARPIQFLKSWYKLFFQMPFFPEFEFSRDDYHAITGAFNGKHGGITNPENRLTDAEEEVFKYGLRRSLSGPINYYRAVMWPFAQPGPPLLYPRKEIEGKPEHTVPILVIWGDADAFLVREMGELTKKCINPSNGSKVVFIEGASHWVQQDEPEKVIELLREFIK